MLLLLLRAGRICRRHSPPAAVGETERGGREGGGSTHQALPGELGGARAAGHPQALAAGTPEQWQDPAGSRCWWHQAHTSLITIPQGLSQTLTLKN